MKYIGPVLLTVATILSGLTLAIVGKSDHLTQYGWATPYLAAAIVLLVLFAVIAFVKSGRQQEKAKGATAPTAPSAQANEQTVTQENKQNVYIGEEFLRQLGKGSKPQPPEDVVATTPQDNRFPRLTIYAYRYPDVIRDHDTGIWREATASDKYFHKGLIFLIKNDVHDDGSGVPADGIRAQLIWKYANGSPGPSLSPAPWLNEPLGIINIPVGASGRLLVGTKNQNYWDGWANLRTTQGAQPSSEGDMLPDRGVLFVRMIGGTNRTWFEAYLKWETDPTYNHPRFRQIAPTEAELIP